MKLTLEIDDDDVRRLLEPLIQGQRTALASPPNSKLMTVKQVAAELGISMSRAYELINKGEIRSLAIGRTRRVPAVALAEFIARPAPRPIELATEPRRASPKAVEIDPTPKPSEVLLARRPRKKEPAPNPLDLCPRPVVPGSHRHQMTDEQWENLYRWLSEKGWPDDVVDRVRAERIQGIERVHMLTLKDTARYLGLSAGSVAKLIKAGKLRLFTIAPTYRNEKPSKGIPAKDVLALTEGN